MTPVLKSLKVLDSELWITYAIYLMFAIWFIEAPFHLAAITRGLLEGLTSIHCCDAGGR